MKRSFAVNIALRSLIEEKCISKSKLATAAGIRPDILSKIVNCKRLIYADEVSALCKALNVSVDELFSEADKTA